MFSLIRKVEVDALPLMVDCRPGAAAAAAHDLAHAHAPHHAHPPTPPTETTPRSVNNSQASGDMGAHALSSPGGAPAPGPAPGRIATPNNTPITTYSGVPMNVNAPYGYGACGVKSLVWCASPPPAAAAAAADIPTLRYYFNLGVECMWAAYGPPQRHYSPRDLAQDMQQISLQDRGPPNGAHDHKHKPGDKPPPNKGNGQRPLLGPRFKRGGNQDGGGPNNHNNKPHNNNNSNNMANNKGQNNRRNSHPEPRGAPAGYEEEPALLPLPYMPYPPPLYPLPYYPVDEPGMLGMMSGMGYVSYEEGAEFAPPLQPYYPQPYPPCQPCPPCPPCPPPLMHPHHPPPHVHPHHLEHK
ncbi:hypothetical protein MSG28_009469 [Choristoneura fumiferana]|uniref:Uncharacterized protein n=1 Tax=Choristoneura fumiferana TaxID=7141 RepID=A0ACC0JBB5_CHOFU|nr:hypothetical protein MSG28_009469 [Choristoneura fumiferana]